MLLRSLRATCSTDSSGACALAWSGGINQRNLRSGSDTFNCRSALVLRLDPHLTGIEVAALSQIDHLFVVLQEQGLARHVQDVFFRLTVDVSLSCQPGTHARIRRAHCDQYFESVGGIALPELLGITQSNRFYISVKDRAR